jgi:hypothetical protein
MEIVQRNDGQLKRPGVRGVHREQAEEHQVGEGISS